MCKRLILLCAVLLATLSSDATQYAYQVNFTDKDGTHPFSDSLTFLSTRSMARRDAQGIVLDSTDLPVTRHYVDSVLHATGGKLHEVSKWLNLCVILVDDSVQMHALDGVSFVSSVKLVAYYPGTLHRDYNRQLLRTTSGSSYYGNTWPQTMMVNGNMLHDSGYTGTGKLIAVVDAGYIGTDTHPGFTNLRSDGRILDVHNFTLDTSFVYGYDVHGTSVLSTMAGFVSGTYVGSAPMASYALYVTEDDNSEQPIELLNLLCAAERADSLGADVISCSLGYNLFNDHSYDFHFATDFDGKTTIAARAANMATAKGMLFVASAGNEGTTGWGRILTPGDADSALTIGSVTTTGINATTSGYGPNAAGRIKPDVCGLGQYAATFDATGYEDQDGTSFSTPEIAGWAACLWQSYPSATPARIRQAIIMCADHYTDPGAQIGYGIPDFGCSAANIGSLDTPLPKMGDALDVSVPNPMTTTLEINVVAQSTQSVDFRLMDITGKELSRFSDVVVRGKNKPRSFDVSNLPAGLYLLKATSPGAQLTIKLVKE